MGKITSNNPIINKILELYLEDLIDISEPPSEDWMCSNSEQLSITGFHLLVASLCISVVNFKTTTGSEKVDKIIERHRNSIIHFESGNNPSKLKYNLYQIVENIILYFELNPNYNNTVYSNIYLTKLDYGN